MTFRVRSARSTRTLTVQLLTTTPSGCFGVPFIERPVSAPYAGISPGDFGVLPVVSAVRLVGPS
jgi:hypothetical protein